MKIKIDVDVECCDECLFYYYSDLHDVCTMLKVEIPFEYAKDNIHPRCPFVGDDE